MIASLGNQGTADIWAGDDTKTARKTLPKELWENARILLDQLEAATVPGDMQLPRSNELHKLKDNLKGYWSVKINKKYRIIFKHGNGEATNVEIIDYH